jgi:hypothetical protein
MHGWQHVVAQDFSSWRCLEEARNRPDVDPLDINWSLEAWNKGKPPAEVIGYEELEMILRIANSFHDAGYGYAWKINEQSKGELFYLVDKQGRSQLYEPGHELRSKQVALYAMKQALPQAIVEKWFPLVGHLIDMTRFDAGEVGAEAPFALLMQMTDQVGQALFNPDAEFATALLHEWYLITPERTFIPDSHFNFVPRRFRALCQRFRKDAGAVLRQLHAIWGKWVPQKEIEGLAKTPIFIAQYLADYEVRQSGGIPVEMPIPVARVPVGAVV